MKEKKQGIIFKIRRRLIYYFMDAFSLRFWQRHGYHVLRNYYYSPVPDLNTLDESIFEKKRELVGINLNEAQQVSFIKGMAAKYKAEYDAFPPRPERLSDFHTGQTTYRSVDAQVLHCMVRELKPKRMIEIGSGFSTLISAKAHVKNAEEGAAPCKFSAIEPYPSNEISSGVPGLTEILDQAVEKADLKVFDSLGSGDILFIDSTHTVKTGGDVVFEVLDILPRLNKGVWVHIHDIFFPYEYPKVWLEGQRFWAEQYMVEAFLKFNEHFEIVWMSHLMHREHPELMRECFKWYEEGLPFKSSLWLRKVK